jgi:hypothetical protein
MNTEWFQALLFKPIPKLTEVGLFTEPRDLAQALIDGGATASSLKPKLSRLFRDGEFSDDLEARLLAASRLRLARLGPDTTCEAALRELRAGLNRLDADRLRSRRKPSGPGVLTEVVEVIKSAESMMRIDPMVRLRGNGEGPRKRRRELANRMHPKFNTKQHFNCFRELDDALEYAFQLTHGIASQSANEFGPADAIESAFESVVGFQRAGRLILSLIRPVICQQHVRVFDYASNVKDLSVYTFVYDPEDNIENLWRVTSPYLDSWKAIVNQICNNDPAIILQGNLQLDDYRDGLMTKLKGLPLDREFSEQDVSELS